MKIAEHTINQIKDVALLDYCQNAGYKLKNSGSDKLTDCPFCNGKNKMSLSPAKNVYKCFSCDHGGVGAVDLVQKSQKIEWIEAIKEVAKVMGIYIDGTDAAPVAHQKNKDPKPVRGVGFDPLPTIRSGTYLRRRMNDSSLAVSDIRMRVKFPRSNEYQEVNILSRDEDDNICFLMYDVDGRVIEMPDGKPAVLKRLKSPYIDKDGKQMKYHIPKIGKALPFFPPRLIEKFKTSTTIDTLVLTEGYWKALVGDANGLDIIGLMSITAYRDKDKLTIHSDIIEVINRCRVKNVIMLYDGDCMNSFSGRRSVDEELKKKKDLAERPLSFYRSAESIRELLKDHLKKNDYNTDFYFAHIKSDSVDGAPKGLDDLYEQLRKNALLEFARQKPESTKREQYKEVLSIKEIIGKEIQQEIATFSKPTNYFYKQNIVTQINKVWMYLMLDNVNAFFLFQKERYPALENKEFIFNRTTYKYNSEKGNCEIMIPGDASRYMRIGDDYFEKVEVPDKWQNIQVQLHSRKKTTIVEDHGKTFTSHIIKLKAFCNVPNNEAWQEIMHNCYNLYFPFEHKAADEDIVPAKTLSFFKHIFGEQYELGLDYIQILYQKPTQILPILCLVSRQNNTGKSTFAKYLKALFLQNMAIVGNAELNDSFNGAYATKLLIAIDEAFIEKKLIIERIKGMSTSDRITLRTMNKDGREIDFFGKFILLSNNEENFVYASEDDIRYWVRKVPVPLTDEIGLLGKMIEEIPYFLRYLSQRKLHSESKSRMWFHPDLIKTNALRKVIENSKPTIEKELRSTLRDMFLDFGLDKIEMTKMHIRQYLLNNKFEVNYIEKVLRENLKADVVRDWMIAPDAIHEQYRGKENTLPEGYRWNAEIQKIEVGVSKVKRGSFLVWQTTINDNKEMDQKVVDIKFNGRPYVFHREDYVSSSDASYVAGTDETSEIDTSIINPDEDTKDLPF